MQRTNRGLTATVAGLATGLAVSMGWSLASGASASAQSLPSEAAPPSCLDQTIKDELGAEMRPRGVQKRDFQKDGHLALVARGGLFGGDLASSSWLAGGAAELYLTEDFGLSFSFDVTPITLDLDEPLAQFFGDDRFEPGLGYLAMANAVWSPVHAKAKMGGGIVHADLLLFAGAGRMFHDSVQGVSFDAGMALDLFVSKVVTVRLDLRDLIAVQEVAAQTRLTNNIIATAGLVVWIPTGLF